MCVCVCGCGWAGLLIRYSDWPQAGQFGNKFRCQRNFPPLHMWPGAFQPPVKWERFVSRGKVRQGRAANHSPHLVPRSWKSRGIFLPILLVTQDLNRFTLTLPIMYVNIYIYIYKHFLLKNHTPINQAKYIVPITFLDRSWEFQEVESPWFQDNQHKNMLRS